MNERKVPCGGFRIGDGLTMEGDTLKSVVEAYINVVPDEETLGDYKIADDSPLNYETAMKYDGFIFIKLYETNGTSSIIPFVRSNSGILNFNSFFVFGSKNVMNYIVIEVYEDNSIVLASRQYTLTPAT